MSLFGPSMESILRELSYKKYKYTAYPCPEDTSGVGPIKIYDRVPMQDVVDLILEHLGLEVDFEEAKPKKAVLRDKD